MQAALDFKEVSTKTRAQPTASSRSHAFRPLISHKATPRVANYERKGRE